MSLSADTTLVRVDQQDREELALLSAGDLDALALDDDFERAEDLRFHRAPRSWCSRLWLICSRSATSSQHGAPDPTARGGRRRKENHEAVRVSRGSGGVVHALHRHHRRDRRNPPRRPCDTRSGRGHARAAEWRRSSRRPGDPRAGRSHRLGGRPTSFVPTTERPTGRARSTLEQQSDAVRPDDRATHGPGAIALEQVTRAGQVPVIAPGGSETARVDGFDWLDAGIGAAAALGLGLIFVGGVVLALRRTPSPNGLPSLSPGGTGGTS